VLELSISLTRWVRYGSALATPFSHVQSPDRPFLVSVKLNTCLLPELVVVEYGTDESEDPVTTTESSLREAESL
jgi:hypothetical protein